MLPQANMSAAAFLFCRIKKSVYFCICKPQENGLHRKKHFCLIQSVKLDTSL